MKISEIMNRNVETVSQDERIQLVARKMRDANIGFVPVVDNGMKVIGTITDRDITIRVVAEGLGLDTKVHDVMSKDVVSVKGEDSIQIAEELMADHQISRLAVLDNDGRLIGVVSLGDISQADDPRAAGRVVQKVKEGLDTKPNV